MTDPIVIAAGMKNRITSTVLKNITPAPPTGPTFDLVNGDFVIHEGQTNLASVKTFEIDGEAKVEIRVYGAGAGGPTDGGRGGNNKGEYTLVENRKYVCIVGGSGNFAGGRSSSGAGGASAFMFTPPSGPAGGTDAYPGATEVLVAGGGGSDKAGFGGHGGGGPEGLSGGRTPNALRSPPMYGGGASGSTGGVGGIGPRRSGSAGANAPRGTGANSVTDGSGQAAGGVSPYAKGGDGGTIGPDTGSGAGGGGYAGGGGGGGDMGGIGGGGGNGYAHPDVTNRVHGQGQTFAGDPGQYGALTPGIGYQGAIVISVYPTPSTMTSFNPSAPYT
tara:strand:+ start:3418 stop:4410 length:993 start_codon:yes stop_codon:yes gene_type:complete